VLIGGQDLPFDVRDLPLAPWMNWLASAPARAAKNPMPTIITIIAVISASVVVGSLSP
jgi:hypothetical protein